LKGEMKWMDCWRNEHKTTAEVNAEFIRGGLEKRTEDCSCFPFC
jgi:hypothetical protein